jgi:hypothetical protein
MPLSIGGIELDYQPGDTYDDSKYDTDQSRAERRQRAIEEFKDAACRTTRGQIHGCCGQLLALIVQLRAMGGVGDTSLANQLREAADFLEDL